VDARATEPLNRWVGGLSREARLELLALLDELCGGLDLSRHNEFGFRRLQAEFETSGELFGCSVEELRQALALARYQASPGLRDPSPGLEALRGEVAALGHPDFR
jgi:hypothetical protein